VGILLEMEKVKKKPPIEYQRPGSTRWNRGLNPLIRGLGRLDVAISV